MQPQRPPRDDHFHEIVRPTYKRSELQRCCCCVQYRHSCCTVPQTCNGRWEKAVSTRLHGVTGESKNATGSRLSLILHVVHVLLKIKVQFIYNSKFGLVFTLPKKESITSIESSMRQHLPSDCDLVQALSQQYKSAYYNFAAQLLIKNPEYITGTGLHPKLL